MKLSVLFGLIATLAVTTAHGQPKDDLFGSGGFDNEAVPHPVGETKKGPADKGLFDDQRERPGVENGSNASEDRSPLDASETACDRIIGGECAQKGRWPSQVAMYIRQNEQAFSFNCGGSLIAKRWVLTAAHCLLDGEGKGRAPASVLFIEGTLKQNGKGGHALKAQRVIVHEKYSSAPLYLNDIALVELTDDARSTPISFNTLEHEDLERGGRDVIAVGWGQRKYIVRDPGDPDQIIDAFTKQPIDPKDAMASSLLEVKIQIIDREACRKRNRPESVTETTLCAGQPRERKNICHGDSGGPLIANDAGQGWVQVGITSNAVGCALPNYPAIFTRVASFEPWIRKNTGLDQGSVPGRETGQIIDASKTGIENEAGLAVSFLQGPQLKIGQTVNVRVTTQQPGYLYLFDVATDGKFTLVYPNRYSIGAKSSARDASASLKPLTTDISVTIPDTSNPSEKFNFTIDPPAGKGRLVAFLSDKPIEVEIPPAPQTFRTRSEMVSYLSLFLGTLERGITVREAAGEKPRISRALFDYVISQ